MRINPISNINFTAIKQDYNAKIVRCNCNSGKYVDVDANIVKFDLDNPNDVEVFDELSYKWEKVPFADDICESAKLISKHKELNDGEIKFYALTTQKSNFDYLNPNKILSICEVSDDIGDGSCYVDYFIANPESLYSINSQYKKVGTGLLKFLQSVYDRFELVPANNKDTKEFYKRNGLKFLDNDEGYGMYWEREK